VFFSVFGALCGFVACRDLCAREHEQTSAGGTNEPICGQKRHERRLTQIRRLSPIFGPVRINELPSRSRSGRCRFGTKGDGGVAFDDGMSASLTTRSSRRERAASL